MPKSSRKKAQQPARDPAGKPPARSLESEEFEAYYRGQGFVPESEWDDFLATLRKPLGVSFRITGSPNDPSALALRDQLERNHVANMHDLRVDGEAVPAPTPISWYPGRMAWRVDVSRAVLVAGLEVVASDLGWAVMMTGFC